MIEAKTAEELFSLLKQDSNALFESRINNLGFSMEEIQLLNLDELQKKLDTISDLIIDKNKLGITGKKNYKRGKDYSIPSDVEPDTVGYGFTAYSNLIDKKKEILELIKIKSRSEKISSIGDLINNVTDTSLRNKMDKELKELTKQTNEFEEQEKELSVEEKEFENSKKQLEISKSKLELLEKKSQIWLTILAKESIASIIGAALLIIMSTCLLIAMFLGINTTEIIESTFLLILGYFFGHAVSKKKE